MTVELRKNQRRLVCSWQEARQSVFQGRSINILRTRTRRLVITPAGSVPERELSKLGSPDRINTAIREIQRLQPFV